MIIKGTINTEQRAPLDIKGKRRTLACRRLTLLSTSKGIMLASFTCSHSWHYLPVNQINSLALLAEINCRALPPFPFASVAERSGERKWQVSAVLSRYVATKEAAGCRTELSTQENRPKVSALGDWLMRPTEQNCIWQKSPFFARNVERSLNRTWLL